MAFQSLEVSTSEIEYDSTGESSFKDVFYQIFPSWVPFVSLPFARAVADEIRARGEALISNFNSGEIMNELWDAGGIEKMFYKGLNPAASGYIGDSVDRIIGHLQEVSTEGSEHFRLVELGCGAGLSTVVTWRKMQESGYDDLTLISVDSSPYAIAATDMLATHFEIPCVIVSGTIPAELTNFKGIVLQIADFETALGGYEIGSVHTIFSNHGTAYMEEGVHNRVLALMTDVLDEGGIAVLDSLDPNLSLEIEDRRMKIGVVLGSIAILINRLTGGRFNSVISKTAEVILGRAVIRGNRIIDLNGQYEFAFKQWLAYLKMTDGDYFDLFVETLQTSQVTQRDLIEEVEVHSEGISQHILPRGLKLIETLSRETHPPFVQTAVLRKV